MSRSSRLRRELALNSRYTAAGVVNSAVGVGVIALLTAVGVNPTAANLGGYAVGVVVSFFSGRHLVFRSERNLAREGGRYVTAFCASYLLNVAVLHVAISRYAIEPFVAQAIAVSSFVVAMYVASRVFVFRGTGKDAR